MADVLREAFETDLGVMTALNSGGAALPVRVANSALEGAWLLEIDTTVRASQSKVQGTITGTDRQRVGMRLHPNGWQNDGTGTTDNFAIVRSEFSHLTLNMQRTGADYEIRFRYDGLDSPYQVAGPNGPRTVEIDIDRVAGFLRLYIDGVLADERTGITFGTGPWDVWEFGSVDNKDVKAVVPIWIDECAINDDGAPLFSQFVDLAGDLAAVAELSTAPEYIRERAAVLDSKALLLADVEVLQPPGTTVDLMAAMDSTAAMDAAATRPIDLVASMDSAAELDALLPRPLDVATFSDYMRTQIHQRAQQSPILQLYEVRPVDGSEPLRYVDFFDRGTPGTLPKHIRFNGFDYEAIGIERSAIGQSSDGERQRFTVTISDPERIGAAILRRNSGLRGASVSIYFIHHHNLEHPENAMTERAEVVSSTITQAPAGITLTVGHPDLFGRRFPNSTYDGFKCPNAFQRRHIVGNPCHYPSNEFGGSTSENFLTGATNAVQKRRFGWSTQQAAQCSRFNSHVTQARHLWMESSALDIRWADDRRNGPNVFREFGMATEGFDGLFDVQCSHVFTDTTRAGWFAGLLIQDTAAAAPNSPDDPSPGSSWLMWGRAEGDLLKRRSTVLNESTDQDFSNWPLAQYLRIVRTAQDTFDLYARETESNPWTLFESATVPIGSVARVGLAMSSDVLDVGALLACRFDYIRFDAGGFTSCQRVREACAERENLHELNAIPGMPLS